MIFLQSQYLLLCMYIMRSYKKQLHNHHLLIVKCGISFLLVALLFLLFVSDHHAIWFPTSLVQTTTTKADLLEPYLPISSNATTTSSDDSSISNITGGYYSILLLTIKKSAFRHSRVETNSCDHS